MPRDLSLDEELDRAIRGRLWDVLTCLPGRVLSYDRTAQVVDVQPLPATYQDGAAVAWPILRDVPVAWPRFGGGSITFPIAAGDYVQLQFQARAIDQFLAEGDEGDPQSPRAHHLADAVAVPGVWPEASRITPVPPAADLEVRAPTGGKILIGQGATAAAARQGDPVEAGPTVAWATWLGAVGTATGAGAPPAEAWTGTVTAGSAVVKVG